MVEGEREDNIGKEKKTGRERKIREGEENERRIHTTSAKYQSTDSLLQETALQL